jgi:hypothetical protein
MICLLLLLLSPLLLLPLPLCATLLLPKEDSSAWCA